MNKILKQKVYNKKKLNEISTNIIILIININFLNLGIKTYLNSSSIFFQKEAIPFFPQGILLFFYGTVGFLITITQTIELYYKNEGGYNKFDKKKKIIRVFRKKKIYKGKNLKTKFKFEDILRV